ncbi:MAG: SDR family oxidoreductase [Fimbriimonadaceae bacterium]|nr:SDR family oxidoreductase [Fimbriimonadaceae bacterium]
MRCVVTGGAGFVGSHLCERLLADGHEVVAIDNLITGSVANIAHLRDPRFDFFHHDVSKFIYLAGAVDFVFHLASPASPVDYLEYPIQTLKVGSLGTHNALGLAKEKGCGLLFASTSEVYGDPLVNPQPETYHGNVSTTGLRGCYDEAKRFGEALVMAYQRQHGIPTRIIRIFNTYGPRMRLRDGRVVPNFICQAVNGEDLTIYGDGQQTRSFCYVDDTVDGMVRLAWSQEALPVNIGNPDERTIRQFAEDILRLTGSRSQIVYQPMPTDNDPQQRRPDITKARTLLGWEPRVPFEEGMVRTIDDMRRRLRDEAAAGKGLS